ncbi:MAG: hypothetical protein DIU70_003665 [Bacillota bacterium]|nr:MAG: hypothetical protein DIU70_00785 [Bacillota bacterium]
MVLTLNTRASLNKAFEEAVQTLGLGLTVQYDQYAPLQPGAGPYPSLVVRILDDQAQPVTHFGRRTPRSPTGAKRYRLMVEAEVRTQSPTFNQAAHIASLLRSYFDGRQIPRRTWLLNATTPNPSPADAGFIRFTEESRLDLLQDEQQQNYKSAFLTWEVEVEIPA